MATHAIEKELVKVTGLKKKKGEKDQKWLARLAKAAAGLDEEVWEELDEDTQEWVNAATTALNDKDDIPAFDALEDEDDDEDDDSDDEDEDDDEDDEDEDEDDEDEKPAPKAKPKAKAKASDKPKRKPGAGKAYRAIMLGRDTLGDKEDMASILEEIREDGYTLSENSAYITYYETIATLRALKDAGLYEHAGLKPKKKPVPPSRKKKDDAADEKPAKGKKGKGKKKGK